MPLKIDDFRNHFNGHNELSRSDKFDVFINIPPQVSQGSGYGIKELALQCEVSELPGRDISLIEYRHYAFTKRIPHMNQYGHINFTFYCGGNLVEKQIFDRWLDIMVPVDTGLVNYPLDDQNNALYESQIQVNQYDQQGNLIYTVNLVDAIPTSVASMPLDWNVDQIHRLSVSFAYFKWYTNQTTYGTGQLPQINDVQTNYSSQNPIASQALPSRQPQFQVPTIGGGIPSVTNILSIQANLGKLFGQ